MSAFWPKVKSDRLRSVLNFDSDEEAANKVDLGNQQEEGPKSTKAKDESESSE